MSIYTSSDGTTIKSTLFPIYAWIKGKTDGTDYKVERIYLYKKHSIPNGTLLAQKLNGEWAYLQAIAEKIKDLRLVLADCQPMLSPLVNNERLTLKQENLPDWEDYSFDQKRLINQYFEVE